jgi:hypothetical protein
MCGTIPLAVGLIASRAPADPAPTTSSLGPVLQVRETARDAGVVDEGADLECQFIVKNRGTDDLEITRVKADCGCTVVHYDKVIKPGAESVLQAAVRTDNLRGSITKYFTLFTNDPAKPEVRLSISARLVPPVQITPGPAARLAVGEGPVSQEFTLERRGDRPMQIVQVVSYASFLTVTPTQLPGQGRYKVTVTASAASPMGRTVVPVLVRTDLQKGGALTLVVTVDRGVVAVPPTLFCGVLEQDLHDPVHAAVTITRHTGTFHIKEATVDDPKLTAKLETVREGAEYRVTVSYAGGWEPGMVSKTLVVTTDDPNQPVLKIPVQALIHAGPTSVPASSLRSPKPGK